MKPVQYFSDEYLEICRKSTPTQIAVFLDDYRSLHANAKLQTNQGPSKLISIRLPLKTLAKLKTLSKEKQIPYQTLIKQMIDKCL
jgi:predicted DNA binding CopG/RHH family protein